MRKMSNTGLDASSGICLSSVQAMVTVESGFQTVAPTGVEG